MDLHRLRVLRCVVAVGSIRGAGSNLGYSPSAISQHLNLLQQEVGLVLLQRAGRGIEPTPAGRRIAAAAGPIFDRLADLEALVSDLRAGRAGALSIGYFASAAAAWLPGVIAVVQHDFPDLRMNLRLAEMTAVEASPFDVEVAVEDPARPEAPGYLTYRLHTEPYVAVVPTSSGLAALPHVELRALQDERWIDYDASHGACRQRLLDACSSVGFNPAFHIEAHDYSTAIRFVAAGMGITVVPSVAATDLPTGTVEVAIMNPAPTRTIIVRVREASAEHPAVIRMVELLRAVLDEASSARITA